MNGDDLRIRNVVLVVVMSLMVALCAIFVVALRNNERSILEAVGVPVAPAPDRSKAGASVRPGDIQRLFGSPENYPQEALDRGEQGLAIASLKIADSGAVERCTITSSSGSRSLDRATCDLFSRLRADPARDANGVAISSTLSLRFRWQLPPE